MSIRRGDVFWVETDGGRRPGAVVTRDVAIPLLTKVMVAPATRTIRQIPAEVTLGPGDGMPEVCVLSIDNLYLVPKRNLKDKIASLPAGRLDEFCDALNYAFGC